MAEYRMCSKCMMDTSDPDITFDEQGCCSHCHEYDRLINHESWLRKRQPGAFEAVVSQIKENGKGKDYDCLIGVSGGVDSTYVAYLTKQLGLRPLAVHLDNGWDSELAVSNIEKALNKLNIDLYTQVLDWEEFRDLQLSFLKSSTPDSEIPTDHAILAVLYKVAARENLKYVICGHNTASEGGGVAAWSQGHADSKYIRSIQKLYGTRPLGSFPNYGIFDFFYYTVIKKIRWIPILDYIDYDKKAALDILQEEMGWKAYGGKHYESIYTRFYQGFILPNKFGFEKRRLHLSGLIWSGQLTRERALEEMKHSDYPEELQQQDKEYVIKKLEITRETFEAIMAKPPKSFWDYPSYKKDFYKYKWLISIYHGLKRS